MIIGITGTISAGKETVAQYLVKKGFVHFSLSNEIRKIARKKDLTQTRDNLVFLGNELRRKYGPGYLAKRVLRKIKGKAVITSIRNLGEVEELRKRKGFILISVDADPRIRYERSRKRNRGGDAKTLKEFIAKENREKTQDKFKQQLTLCIEEADYKIENNGTKKELYEKIEKILQQAPFLG